MGYPPRSIGYEGFDYTKYLYSSTHAKLWQVSQTATSHHKVQNGGRITGPQDNDEANLQAWADIHRNKVEKGT